MNKTFPTPYPELNSVLRDFVGSVQAVLGINFVGAYLQGSFAVGDFDLHSDVDFIIVIAEELSRNQVDALQVMQAHLQPRISVGPAFGRLLFSHELIARPS